MSGTKTTRLADPQHGAVRGVDPTIPAADRRTGTAGGTADQARQTLPRVPKCYGHFDSNAYQCMRRCRFWHRCLMEKWTTADFPRDLVLT